MQIAAANGGAEDADQDFAAAEHGQAETLQSEELARRVEDGGQCASG
jgi:hypothetical protein